MRPPRCNVPWRWSWRAPRSPLMRRGAFSPAPKVTTTRSGCRSESSAFARGGLAFRVDWPEHTRGRCLRRGPNRRRADGRARPRPMTGWPAAPRQARTIADACRAASIPLVLGGSGAWPESPALGAWRVKRCEEFDVFLRTTACSAFGGVRPRAPTRSRRGWQSPERGVRHCSTPGVLRERGRGPATSLLSQSPPIACGPVAVPCRRRPQRMAGRLWNTDRVREADGRRSPVIGRLRVTPSDDGDGFVFEGTGRCTRCLVVSAKAGVPEGQHGGVGRGNQRRYARRVMVRARPAAREGRHIADNAGSNPARLSTARAPGRCPAPHDGRRDWLTAPRTPDEQPRQPACDHEHEE